MLNKFLDFVSLTSTAFMVIAFIPPIMDVVLPLNETREKTPPFPTNYGVDPQKYFYFIGLHGYMVSSISMIWIWTTDSLVMIMVYHCSTLFKFVG